MPRRKTHAEFVEQMAKVNPDIEVLGQYKTTNTKIKVRHTCDHKWEARPRHLLNGSGCPKCSIEIRSRKKTKTNSQFVEELKVKQPNIEPVEEYQGVYTKIKVRHTCGHEWEVVPNDLLSGKSCPKCFGTPKKTHSQFVEELKDKQPDIKPLEEYKTARTKLKVTHITCGYEWEVAPYSLLSGYGCPKCGAKKAIKKRTKTHVQFVEEMKVTHPDIEVLGEYKTTDTKIKVRHTCGHEWEATPANLLYGKGCPKCAAKIRGRNRRKSHSEFVAEMKGKQPDIEVLGKYITDSTKLKVRHNCGYVWESTPNSLLSGAGCPKCASSKSEKYLAKLFKEKTIPYISQVRVEGTLRRKLDFYLPEYDLYIECNGEQHYKKIEYFHKSKNDFIHQILRDLLIFKIYKNKILIIPYTITNYEELFDNDSLNLEFIDNCLKCNFNKVSKALKELGLSNLYKMSIPDLIKFGKSINFKL